MKLSLMLLTYSRDSLPGKEVWQGDVARLVCNLQVEGLMEQTLWQGMLVVGSYLVMVRAEVRIVV